ncbi:uncharacterized protein LOC141648040 isoform X9 [Silene latifolia]|uniref:uncharacterized protein LOC141648040 isoform X9 n=1 Tax=Silene latifolia TaxID=37657 RepID=UPI003D785645
MGVCQYIFIFQSRQYLSFFLVGSEWHGSALASMQGLCLIVQLAVYMESQDLGGQGDYVYDEASGYYYTNSSGYYYDPSTGLFWLHPQDSVFEMQLDVII